MFDTSMYLSLGPVDVMVEMRSVMHLSMLSPRGGGGGGTLGICGAFDFSEEFLVKIPTVGPQNWVKSDQISPPFPSIYIENE